MSRMRSRLASNTIRSAISAVALSLSVACASKVNPPTASISPLANSHVGVAVQLDGSQSVSLRSSNPLSYAWSFTALPPRSQAKLNDGHLAKPSFTPDVAGTYALMLTVDDGILASSATVTVTVNDDCRPTVTVKPASETPPQVGQTAGFSVTPLTSCGGSTIVAYQWSIASAPAGSSAKILLATTARPSFAPDVRGDYDLVVQVTDSLGLTSDMNDPTSHFRITTQACGDNSPVVGSIAAVPGSVDVGSQVALSAKVTDQDSDPAPTGICGLTRSFTYAWALLEMPAGSAARLNNSAIKAPSFTPDLHGHYVVGLVVTDNLGRASQQLKQPFDTTACGDSIPTASASSSATSVVATASVPTGTSVQLHTFVTDADNASYNGPDSAGGGATTPVGGACAMALTYSYSWMLVSAPIGSAARLNNGTLANPSFVADVQGTYVLSVVGIASTGHASVPSFIAVTAIPCGSVPISAAIAAMPAVGTGTSVQLSANVTDGNGACSTPTLTIAPVNYAWTIVSAPAGSKAQLSGTNASGLSLAASPSITPDLAGDYVFGLAVADQLGLKAIAPVVTLHANACNLAPVATISYGTQPIAGIDGGPQTGQSVSLSAAVTDGNTVTNGCAASTSTSFSYAWSMVNQPAGSAAQLNSTVDVSPSFTPDVIGTYRVQVIVTDGAGNRSAPAQADISNVSSCTQPLAISSISMPSGLLGTGAPIALTATVAADPNLNANNPGCALMNPLLSFSWSLVGLPNGSHAVLNNANASNPSFVPDIATSTGQTYVVQLVVTDAAGNKSPALQQSISVGTCSANISGTLGFSAVTGVGQPITVSVTGINDPNTVALGCPNPGALTYNWQLVGQPTGSRAQLNNRAAAAPSFVPDAVTGTQPYIVALTVTDAVGNKSAFPNLSIPVGATCNQALTFGSPPTIANARVSLASPGTPVSVILAPATSNAVACSATAFAYTYAWSMIARPAKSGASLIDPTASTVQFVADQPGSYVLIEKATDQLGNSGTTTISVTVSGCGTNPTVNAVASTVKAEIGQAVLLTATVPADTNAAACGAPTVSPFSYAWALTGPAVSNAVLNGARNAQAAFVPDMASATGWSYSVVVTDALGFQGASLVGNVQAVSCAMTPTASVLSPAVAGPYNIGTPVQLNAGVLFAAGCTTPPQVSYQWSFDTLPTGSTSFFNNPSVQSPTFMLDKASSVATTATWSGRVTVTDLVNGSTVTAPFNVASTTCGSTAPVAKSAANGSAPASGTSTAPSNGGTYTVGGGFNLQLDGTATSTPNALCTNGLNYQWSIYALPPGSNTSIRPANAAKPTMNLDVVGTYVVKLIVTDGLTVSAPTYMSITGN